MLNPLLAIPFVLFFLILEGCESSISQSPSTIKTTTKESRHNGNATGGADEDSDENSDKNSDKNSTVEAVVELQKGEEFEKKITFKTLGRFSLRDAPAGMRIYQSGILRWTPTNEQIGEHNITVVLHKEDGSVKTEHLAFTVTGEDVIYDGVFVDLDGRSGGEGTPVNPYGTYEEACKKLGSRRNIYLRGDIYHNPGFGKDYGSNGRYPSVKACVGDPDDPIVIRPWGNEYVTLKTDALYGIKVQSGSSHIVIKDLEVVGVAQEISLEDAISAWWDKNDTMQGSGIVVNGGHVKVKNCVVHDMPGSGISASGAVFSELSDNIVYNCDWWTIAGSKGIGITSAKDDSSDPANNRYKNAIVNNLIFNVEQRLFSHVWKKGFATLSIDEGEAFLIQEGKRQDGSVSSEYSGRYLVKNNLILYNGKSGVINLAKNVDLLNNSYYNNGLSTQQSGFRVNTAQDIVIKNNAVESNIPETIIYSVANSDPVTIEANHVKGRVTKNGDPVAGIEKVSTLFRDPEHFDFRFSKSSQVPEGIGVDQDVILRIRETIDRYGIAVRMQHMDINQTAMTEMVIRNRPAGSTVDCSHYDDKKNPYVTIENIPRNHPIVAATGNNSFKLFIHHKSRCEE